MRRKIIKLFSIGAFEKEEKWLTQMDAMGLRLLHVGYGNYTFEEAAPEGYVYRLELLDHMPSHPESQAYIRFVEETGAEYVGSIFRWVYFRKRAEEGDFELFSDIDSKIRHYWRILSVSLAVSVIWLTLLCSDIASLLESAKSFSDWQYFSWDYWPKSMYNLIWIGRDIVILCILQLLVSPIYKRLHQLKKMKKISE